MARLLTLCLALGLTAALAADDKAPAPLDPAKLIGDWTSIEGTKAGEKAPDAGKGTVNVTKDKITLKSDDMTFVFGYTVDVKVTPATIDLEMLEPEAFGKPKAKGIVKLADGKVSLCYHPMGGDRPKDFTSTKENGNFLFVMKKKEPADKPKPDEKKDK
jgi:uncharacterized protein (TIGR03067 family)